MVSGRGEVVRVEYSRVECSRVQNYNGVEDTETKIMQRKG